MEPASRKALQAERPSAMVLPRKRQVHVDIVSCGVGNLVFTLARATGKNGLRGSLYKRCRGLRTVACERGDRRIDREEMASLLREAGIFPTTRQPRDAGPRRLSPRDHPHACHCQAAASESRDLQCEGPGSMQQALSHSRKVYSVQTFHVTNEAGLWDTRQCGPCDICQEQALRLDKKHEKMLNEAREIARMAWAQDSLPILP